MFFLLGRAAFDSALRPEDCGSGDCDEGSCDLFTLLEEGSWGSAGLLWVGFERGGERREEFGTWIPSDGRDRDLRRVLYGMARLG